MSGRSDSVLSWYSKANSCSASSVKRTSLLLLILALGLLSICDLEIHSAEPWQELGRIGFGLISPDFWATEQLLDALLNTLAFALLGVALAVPLGGLLALGFGSRLIRSGCAFVRSIHELFWALLLMQLFGLTTLTAVLAIAIPYSAIFAKVYAEILEESDLRAWRQLAPNCDRLSAFLYTRLPQAYPALRDYSRYRLECGIRSSAVLGFIGLPTLGFHLETAFSQGHYSESAALLYLFFGLILGLRKLFCRAWLLPIYIIAAICWLPWQIQFDAGLMLRFLTEDLLPAPLRHSTLGVESWQPLTEWLLVLLKEQALVGAVNTLVLSFVAMVGSGVLALLLFALVSQQFFGSGSHRRALLRQLHNLLLVVMRSIPELMLAFVALLLLGPSMLPALLALVLHNAAIVGQLIGQYSDTLSLRRDSARGLNRYLFEVLPRVYRQFLAFLFYRWEVILRESAILGILGIQTLGFYIDTAFEELRFDRALVLILITALLNLGVDSLSRWLRLRLQLGNNAKAC